MTDGAARYSRAVGRVSIDHGLLISDNRRLMGALVLAVVVVGAAWCALIVALKLRSRHTPHELRGDWWPDFERQFRAYVERLPSSDTDVPHRRTERRSKNG